MSHSTLTIEEKVDKFNEESKVIFETIVEGSDEHLDRILSIITPLSSVTDKLSAFNEDIFENIGSESHPLASKRFAALFNHSSLVLFNSNPFW